MWFVSVFLPFPETIPAGSRPVSTALELVIFLRDGNGCFVVEMPELPDRMTDGEAYEQALPTPRPSSKSDLRWPTNLGGRCLSPREVMDA